MPNQQKEKLFSLIESFLNEEITEDDFCERFYFLYSREFDYDILSKEELSLLRHLSETVSRFSNYPEDFKLDPRAFVGSDELRKKQILYIHHCRI
jgi:hypothetical protein